MLDCHGQGLFINFWKILRVGQPFSFLPKAEDGPIGGQYVLAETPSASYVRDI